MKERLKILRSELGYTQEEFAKRLGLARNSIANYEIGRREQMLSYSQYAENSA